LTLLNTDRNRAGIMGPLNSPREDAMNVGEICTRTTVICDRNTSVLETSQLMRTSHVGDVIVTDERGGVRFPVGIVTDRDIVVGVVAKQVDPALVSAGEIMGGELVTALESEDLLEAIRRMRGKGVRRLPMRRCAGGFARHGRRAGDIGRADG
jgi:CBS domain-containing protein